MKDNEYKQLAKRFGTPTYIFDVEAFRDRLKAVRALFGKTVSLCYSIKANPFLIDAALAENLSLEVCSPGELAICEMRGVDPKRIVYSGVCKREDDVRRALQLGVAEFTAESPLQLELIEREARAAKKRVPVLLRLEAGSQFGMTSQDLSSLVKRRASFSAIEFVGIHYFAGTQRRKLARQRKELVRLDCFAKELEQECGWYPHRLEYGPGLGISYFEGEDFSDSLAPARELADDLKNCASHYALTVEMGRFFASECGSYLTRIVDIKSGKDTRYAFIDGGIHHVSYYGQMMGMKIPHIKNLTRSNGGDAGPWTLCGSLCTTADVLARELCLPLELDDIVAFDRIGAYSVTEAPYLFLSRTMPRVVIRHGEGNYELVRDHLETSILNTVSLAQQCV